MIPTSIDGTDITGATIDGTDVQEITVDGDTVFSAGPTIPASAVSRYRFDEGSGTTASDSIGSNDATISGATYSSNSKEGSFALEFVPSGDVVDLPNSIVNIDGSLSIAMWAFHAGTGNGNPWYGAFNDGNNAINMQYNNNGNKKVSFFDGSNEPVSNAVLNLNEWYHIVFVIDYGNTTEIYIDGQLDTSKGNTSPSSGAPWSNHIGNRENGTKTWDGRIDDVIIMNQAISSSEVSDLFNSY